MYDNILLRLNEKLTSDEAQSYIIAVQNIIEGKDIEKCIISSENTSSIFVYFSDSLSDDEITKLGENKNFLILWMLNIPVLILYGKNIVKLI